jgi:hypothetical protein
VLRIEPEGIVLELQIKQMGIFGSIRTIDTRSFVIIKRDKREKYKK